MVSPLPPTAFADDGDVVIPHRVVCPARNSCLAPYLEAATFPTGPFSTASPRKAGEVDRRGLVIASPAVERLRTDAIRNEAAAEAGRSDFP